MLNKPGHVADCPDCSGVDIPIYRAKVAYPSKNSCLAEFEFTTNHAEAHAFNVAQRRMGGSGVTGSLIQTKS